MDDYLSKPLDAKLLGLALARVIRPPGPSRGEAVSMQLLPAGT
jgi:hypothetical protein